MTLIKESKNFEITDLKSNVIMITNKNGRFNDIIINKAIINELIELLKEI